MDHESFLDLLFPELDGLEEWDCLSSSPSQVHGWNDYLTSSSSSSALDTLVSDLQETPSYASVLKISDISSVLPTFSSSQAKVADAVPSSDDNGVAAGNAASVIGKRSHEAAFEMGGSAARLCPSLADSTASPSVFKANLDGCFQREVSSSVTSMRAGCLRSAGIPEREQHIHSERQRRKSMRESFTVLRSLIPKLSKLKPSNRIRVLTEVMEYIRRLKDKLEDLEKKKIEMMGELGISDDEALLLGASGCSPDSFTDGSCSHVGTDGATDGEAVVRVRGKSVFVTVRCSATKTKKKKVGVLPALLMLLQSGRVDVVNASLTTCAGTFFYSIHGTVADGSTMDGANLQARIRRVIASG